MKVPTSLLVLFATAAVVAGVSAVGNWVVLDKLSKVEQNVVSTQYALLAPTPDVTATPEATPTGKIR